MLILKSSNRFFPIGSDFCRNGQLVDGPTFLGIRIEPSVKKLEKDPLSPTKVLDIRGGNFPIPIVGKTEHLELPTEVVDVFFRRLARRFVGADGLLFGRKTKSVKTHGVKHRSAFHSPVPTNDVCRRITLRVPNMKT